MNVNSVTYSPYNYSNTATAKPTRFDLTNATDVQQVHISENGRIADTKWQSIANKYDVHNISDVEAGAMSRDLFDAGFINTTQMMILMAPSSMNETPLKKHDMLNDMKYTFQISASLGGHSPTSKEHYLNAINVLERLKDSRAPS
ncbi:hypothetical protein [Pseudoalteromonas obscura]|uniref:Uncharacterized protein n=1 Tax=Pseudoalteromonas obscura TaxID=3048491 RepID=A0ABT7EL78_9GAMM|nr:hypothetical protein [Pseudoalteromonas sp. P94(2023)]MDK2595784.1 hypothetical protein [Pseudoalteromonas sp. P94(2023)]